MNPHEAIDNACLHAALSEFDKRLDPMNALTVVELGSRDCIIANGLARHYLRSMVIAWECNPEAVTLCRRNRQARVLLVEKLAASFNGTLPFLAIDPKAARTPHADGNIGASSRFAANPEYPHETYVQKPVTVQTGRFDTWAKEHGVESVDVVWADCQGGELDAFKGFGRLIETVCLLYTEVLYKPMYHGAPLFRDVNHWLHGHGFHLVKEFNTNDWFGDVLYERP